MKLWDPHFHLWDVSPETRSGHDAGQLPVIDGDPVYDRVRYESDLAVDGFELTGGALVEAVSVCHVKRDGPRFAEACVSEARWVSSQLAASPLDYAVVASAPLEDPRPSRHPSRSRGLRRAPRHPADSEPRALVAPQREPGGLPRPAGVAEGIRTPRGALPSPSTLQLNPSQFRKAARLLARHPGILIVIGHLGSPTAADLREATVYWEGLEALADLEQAYLKISMLSYTDREWDRSPLVRDSVHRAMDLFGMRRCMFASNFPVEKHVGWPVGRLYGAFRGLAAHLDAADRQRLFADNARRAYGIPGAPSG